MAEGEVDTPKFNRSEMMEGVAEEGSSLEGRRRKRERDEELAKPEVRDDKQGFAGYHASEVGIVEGDGIDDGPELLSS
jgi:hypothetical protein